MSKYSIYNKNGKVIADPTEFEYNGSFMGACSITVSVNSSVPINFSIGDYIDYRGERYTLNYTPSVIKQSSVGASGNSFVYNGIIFDSVQSELSCLLRDLVINDNEIHTGLATFSFYDDGSLKQIRDRVQAVLDDVYGKDFWIIRLIVDDLNADDKYYIVDKSGLLNKDGEKPTDYNYSMNGNSVWDLLAQANENQKVVFSRIGRTITIGKKGDIIDIPLSYGKGNGIKTLENSSNSSEKIVTRLRAYGTEKNMPYRYYNYKSSHPVVTATRVENSEDDYFTFVEVDFFDLHDYVLYEEDMLIGGVVVSGSFARGFYDYNRKLPDWVNETSCTKIKFYSEEAKNIKVGTKISFINVGKMFPIQYYEFNQMVSMYVPQLMLPHFAEKSTDENLQDIVKYYQADLLSISGNKVHVAEININDVADISKSHKVFKYVQRFKKDVNGIIFCYDCYIDSLSGVKKYGLKEDVKTFDGSDTFKEIYPSFKWLDVKVRKQDNVTDNGIPNADGKLLNENGGEITTFDVIIDYPQFLLSDKGIGAGKQATMTMQSGMCGSRSFNIIGAGGMIPLNENFEEIQDISDTSDRSKWKYCKVTCERLLDDSIKQYFPNNNYHIKEGDTFTFEGIYMPNLYVEAAEEKLLHDAILYLNQHDNNTLTIKPEIDSKFLATQISESPLRDIVKEGMRIRVIDDDLNLNTPIDGFTISNLVIKENESNIPIFDITLSEEKTADFISQVLSEVKQGISSQNGWLNTKELQSILRGIGKNEYLSKVNADTAQSLITFLQGLKFSNAAKIDGMGNAVLNAIQTLDFLKGTNGFGVWLDENGRAHGQIDFLEVLGKAIFRELEIRKLSAVGGDIVLSPASSTITKVEKVKGGWRCYLHTDDGTMRTQNGWRVGDQAKCQTFNIKEGVYEDVSNRYYWRVVTKAVDKTQTEEAYVVLSDDAAYKDAMGTDAPKAGDVIVLCGHNATWDIAHGVDPSENTDRMNVTMLTTSGVGGGTIDVYRNVHDFKLTGANATFHLTSEKLTINSERLEWRSGGGEAVPHTLYRGDWYEGVTAYKNEVWYHGGQGWLSVANDNTDEPSQKSAKWKLQVKKGEKGDKGDEPYVVSILSLSGGNIIRNGKGAVTLLATVQHGSENISDRLEDWRYSWEIKSGNEEYDKIWNARHQRMGRKLTLTGSEVARQALVECVVEIEEE